MKKWPFLLFTTVGLSLTLTSSVVVAASVETDSVPSAFTGQLMSAKTKYTVANTHSHNDYEQPVPFWMAWQERFGSIEADIWLIDGQVLVGHNREEIKNGRTLEEYYIKPLLSCIRQNNGYPYSDTSRRLQILIDVKMDSVNTLNAMIALLDRYPDLEHCPALTFVISGNRPAPDLFSSYPPFIQFDGVLRRQYPAAVYSRIAMLSEDLKYYTQWDGTGPLSAADKKTLREVIDRAHALHLPVRFWDAPDTPNAWAQLMQLHVDFLNTDHIRELSTWLKDRE